MSVTMLTGPLGPERGGTFNVDPPILKPRTLYLEGSPKRVRAEFAGETIADSRHVNMLFETGELPVYYFPRDDVRMNLLQLAGHATHCPFKGDAAYWSSTAGWQPRRDCVREVSQGQVASEEDCVDRGGQSALERPGMELVRYG